MGDWSITITLSSCSPPTSASNSPGTAASLPSMLRRAGSSTSLTSELLPLPETPVIQTNSPSGISTSILFRLLWRTPSRIRVRSSGFRRVSGTTMASRPERKAPVMLRLFFSMSCGEPVATTSPPRLPGPGPKSTTQSAARMVSSSCSTTTTVFPLSRSVSRAPSSLMLSRGCSPIDGSSST